MKLTKDQFNKLQKEWYDKLEAKGFKDVEVTKGEEVVLEHGASSVLRHSSAEVVRQSKELYYSQLSKKVHAESTQFKDIIHKLILMRHAEGFRITDIQTELALLGILRHKQSIGRTIERYVVLWKIKTPKKKKDK